MHPSPYPLPPGAASISALVLAGGRGQRVGGQDKGLMDWRGHSLVAQVLKRVRPQVTNVLISCNRNRDRYASYAPLASPDRRPDFQGPLAGLESAAADIAGDYVLVVPCDTPMLPADLARRLLAALLQAPEAGAAYAVVDGAGQYLCALIRRTALASLPAFLDSGARAVRDWYTSIRAIGVEFNDEAECFLNLNELD